MKSKNCQYFKQAKRPKMQEKKINQVRELKKIKKLQSIYYNPQKLALSTLNKQIYLLQAKSLKMLRSYNNY